MHLSDEEAKTQGARCMDCGIPFCNNGCPVNNIIPDWNDLVFKQDWEAACRYYTLLIIFLNLLEDYVQLHVRPACVLGINSDPCWHQVN